MDYLEIIYTFFATFFFSVIFNLSGKKLFYSSICGALGWFTHLLIYQYYSKTTSYFIAALVITAYSEMFAKKNRTTVTTTLIPGLLPLVPGSGIYYTMSFFVERNIPKASEIGLETLFLTVALSLGIFLVSTLFQIFNLSLKYFRIMNKYNWKKYY